MDYGVDMSDSSLSSRDEDEMDAANSVSIRKIPIEADFLFAYSTVPGTKCLRQMEPLEDEKFYFPTCTFSDNLVRDYKD